MTSHEEPVKTWTGVGYYRKWWQTLRQARKIGEMPADWRVRLRVRRQACGPIRRPVFILGCPRSGTTFLGKVLQALPNGSYYFEPPAMKYYTRLVCEGRVSTGQARRFYRWGARALLLAAPGSGPRFIEKNPKHTLIAETLYATFPDAQFVIITRDGRDVSLSLSERPWHRRDSLGSGRREPGGYLYGPHPHFYIEPERAEEYRETSDLHRCIWIWRRYAEEVERLRNGGLPPEVQFHVTYEDLVHDPSSTMGRMLEFLGEDDERSRQQVMEVAAQGHRSSVGRWRDAFGDEDLQVIEREAGEMLRTLEYLP